MSANLLRSGVSLALCIVPAAAYLALFAKIAAFDGAGGDRRSRTVSFGFFAGYVLLLSILTLAPPPISPSNGGSGVNFVPVVRSLRCFVPDPGQPPTAHFCMRIFAGNLLMFLPMGFLLPLISAKFSSMRSVLVVALATSASIEVLQAVGSLVGSGRWTDIDDVILNVAGAALGYAAYRAIGRLRPPARSINAKGGTRTPTDFSTGS